MPHDTERRFWSYVKSTPKNECWLWAGGLARGGYGHFYMGANAIRRGAPRMVYAHRYSYELFHGRIPEHLEIDHLCRVRNCVNPAHLEAVTHKENCKRGIGGWNSAIKTHCPAGHAYSGYNVLWIKRKTGKIQRHCRTCCVERTRQWQLRQRAHTEADSG